MPDSVLDMEWPRFGNKPFPFWPVFARVLAGFGRISAERGQTKATFRSRFLECGGKKLTIKAIQCGPIAGTALIVYELESVRMSEARTIGSVLLEGLRPPPQRGDVSPQSSKA